jgi:hypothetical protein
VIYCVNCGCSVREEDVAEEVEKQGDILLVVCVNCAEWG